MKFPEWLKPAVYGAVAGAVAISIAGFSWGGWVTGSSAREIAADQARLEVVAALVPVCVEQSRQDPNVIATLASLKDESSYKRARCSWRPVGPPCRARPILIATWRRPAWTSWPSSSNPADACRNLLMCFAPPTPGSVTSGTAAA